LGFFGGFGPEFHRNLHRFGCPFRILSLHGHSPSIARLCEGCRACHNHTPALDWQRSTRQVALGSVRTFFEFCASQGWIVADPSRQVALDYSTMTHEQKEATDKQPFTEDEVKHLVKVLTADLKLCETGKQELFREPHHVLFWLFAVRLGAETGLRLSDIAQLEWRSLSELGLARLSSGWRRPTTALSTPSAQVCNPSSAESR